MDAEEIQIWREHESVACLIHLWRMLDNSIMCQAAKRSNFPLLENSIRCPLTHFDDDCPLAEDVEKTTQCCFCYDESCSLLLWLSIAHWRICWCSLLMTNAHCLMKRPTGCFTDVVETFSLKTTYQFHWQFPPFVSWKERQSSPKYIWTPPLQV